MEKECCVYWVRYPSHSNLLKEGYIGITTVKLSHRWLYHQYQFKKGFRTKFARVIEKRGKDAFLVEKLCVGTAEYCREIEQLLRPRSYIGWNTGIGGQAAFLGFKHSQAAREAMSRNMKGRTVSAQARINIGLAGRGRIPSAETRLKQSLAAKAKGFSDTHKANISAAKKGINTNEPMWLHPKAKKEIWVESERIYDLCQTYKRIPTNLLIEGMNASSICRMRSRFNAGWNPYKDAKFQEWKNS